MSFQDHYIHTKFGVDEIYIHKDLSYNLLEKLYQRAALSLDAEDPIIKKYAAYDMVLIFYKQPPKPSLIYRFLESIEQDKNKENYIKSNTLINEEELFTAIKSKKFVLITRRTLVKDTYSPV